jgi:hypothetical protein
MRRASSNIPEMKLLDKLSVLYQIVEGGQEVKDRVGHMVIQKLVYLLQQAKGVPLGYNFALHYYGPYSEELWSDLWTLQDWGYLDIATAPDGYGYIITAKRKPTWQSSRGVSKSRQSIKELWEFLKGKSSHNLELYATTHFVSSDLREKERPADEESVVEKVIALKPHFRPEAVKQALRTLQEKGLLLTV